MRVRRGVVTHRKQEECTSVQASRRAQEKLDYNQQKEKNQSISGPTLYCWGEREQRKNNRRREY